MYVLLSGGGDYASLLPTGSYIDAMPQTPENLGNVFYFEHEMIIRNVHIMMPHMYR